MIRVSEVIYKGKSKFLLEHINKGNELISSEDITSHSYFRDKNDYTYIFLYSNHYELDRAVFNFLNMPSESMASRKQSMTAMKLLLVFEQIIGKKVWEFSQSDLVLLKTFLHGNSSNSNEFQIILATQRSNATVNIYLSTYRKYCKFIGRENKALNEGSTANAFFGEVSDGYSKRGFKSSERKMIRREVPRYISVEDFLKILGVIEREYTIREEIIVSLMFECGLRIGEVLGLTIDDIAVETIPVHREDGTTSRRTCCIVYLRNRVSDDPSYQSAKGCMKVVSKQDYLKSDYINYGFETVVLPDELYDKLSDYINNVHMEARQMNEARYWANVRADRVPEEVNEEEPNFYIFLNKKNRILTQRTWNNTIKEIFEKCDIQVDVGRKRNNLNHRFRHGFAMMLSESGYSSIDIKTAMRHKSISSTAVYHRPTIEDSIKMKDNFIDYLHNKISTLQKNDGAEE